MPATHNGRATRAAKRDAPHAPSAWPTKNATSVAAAAGVVAPNNRRSQRCQVTSIASAAAPQAKASASTPAARAGPRVIRAYLIASGLIGDPTAPVIGSGGAVNRNA